MIPTQLYTPVIIPIPIIIPVGSDLQDPPIWFICICICIIVAVLFWTIYELRKQ